MINNKRNHHFVAQVEQIFHARSSEVKAKKINRFKVDSKKQKLNRTSNKGITIANNLSFEDLYCFHFLSREKQYNFEDTFGRYESDYKELIGKVIYSDEATSKYYLNLFTYKFLNIIRNPFCIRNVLSMFRGVLNFVPAEPELLALYKLIEDGDKPHEKIVCEYFGVTKIEYIDWLKLLFLVLSVDHDGTNFLEFITRRMFYEKESSLHIFLYNSSEKYTVFSDVGFTSITYDAHFIYEFPLTNSHYIAYCFTNTDAFFRKLEEEKDLNFTDIQESIKRLPKEVKVKKVYDNLAHLQSFNARMVERSWQYVFSKATKPFVL